jgi:hypothetical protein
MQFHLSYPFLVDMGFDEPVDRVVGQGFDKNLGVSAE